MKGLPKEILGSVEVGSWSLSRKMVIIDTNLLEKLLNVTLCQVAVVSNIAQNHSPYLTIINLSHTKS